MNNANARYVDFSSLSRGSDASFFTAVIAPPDLVELYNIVLFCNVQRERPGHSRVENDDLVLAAMNSRWQSSECRWCILG